MPMWALFETDKLVIAEANRRAWSYLRALGYSWYREVSMLVSLFERGEIQLVKIDATYEQYHSERGVLIEVPLKQFEQIVPHKQQVINASAPILPG